MCKVTSTVEDKKLLALCEASISKERRFSLTKFNLHISSARPELNFANYETVYGC